MSETKILHRTIIVILDEEAEIDVSERAFKWEKAADLTRKVYRVEPAIRGSKVHESGGIAWLINLEVTSATASKYDLTKFMKSYLPEADFYYITE